MPVEVPTLPAPTSSSAHYPGQRPASNRHRPMPDMYVAAGQGGTTVPRGLANIESAINEAPVLNFRSDRPFESGEEQERRRVAAAAHRSALDAQCALQGPHAPVGAVVQQQQQQQQQQQRTPPPLPSGAQRALGGPHAPVGAVMQQQQPPPLPAGAQRALSGPHAPVGAVMPRQQPPPPLAKQGSITRSKDGIVRPPPSSSASIATHV